MATTPVIVLVHSSSVGPSTWAAVAGELRSHGADVRVPSMLGFAEDGPPYARAYVNRAAAALASLPMDRSVLLVAHSNAGLFLPALAEALEPREVGLRLPALQRRIRIRGCESRRHRLAGRTPRR